MNYAEVAELLARGGPAVVATVVRTSGSSPREPGTRMVVLPDGTTHGTVGGGTLEKKVVGDALALLGRGGTALRAYGLRPEDQGGIGMECGGESEVFLEVAGASERLLVLGGGHVGLALHRLARELGWETVVVDEREAYADPSRFPGARQVLRASYGDRETLASLVTPRTAAVVVTHSHPTDQEALGSVLGAGAFYVGMIGSARKVRTLLGRLAEAGADAGELSAVHAPIGLHLGAESPAEIALSILGEILAARNGLGPEVRSLKEEKRRGRDS